MSSVRVHRSRVGPSCRVNCSRRTCIRPICFLPTLSHLTTSAASFPTPFNNTLRSNSRAPGAVVLSPVIQFHDSFWRHELTKLDDDRHPAHVKGQLLVGAGAQMQAVETFQQAYAPHGMVPLGSKLVAVDEHERTAFVMFATQVINTGSYGGSPATQLSSTVHGVYRLQFDDEGVVTHAWCHRSPTSEEYAILMAKSSERQSQVDVDLPACTWPTDDRYTRSIHAAAADWMEDVCSKASLQAIFKLASPELRYNDGTCLHLGAPLHGITSFLEHVAKESTERQLGTRVALATAADANKVFMHWKQASICRRSHDMSDIEGVTVLAFNQDAKVTQVIEYRTPSQQDVSQLFKGAASGSAVLPAAPSAVAGTSSAAESMWDAETADALARQSQEWESW